MERYVDETQRNIFRNITDLVTITPVILTFIVTLYILPCTLGRELSIIPTNDLLLSHYITMKLIRQKKDSEVCEISITTHQFWQDRS